MFIYTFIFSILSLQLGYADIQYPVDYPKENCVAWKTKKTMFLIKKLEPVGISCDVKISLAKDKNEKDVLRFDVPIASFDSGDSKRDTEVEKILKAKKQANLIFSTKEGWLFFNNKAANKGQVKGELLIGGESHSVTFSVSKVKDDGEWFYLGKSILKYSDLNIKPPSVVGGAVAKVKNYLELHFIFSHQTINKSL